MGQVMTWLAALLLGQRGHLFPWAPVCLATGIGVYFALRAEPSATVLWACGGIGCLALVQHRAGPLWGPLLGAVALAAAGFALAGVRAQQVAGPVLDFRYFGAIEGRVIQIDRSASDALRLTLDRVVLERMDPDEVPLRVRVSLHGQQGYLDPRPGQVVILTGHLSPPGGAVEPGGFDFRRHAWFLRLGAVGYTRSPVLLLQEADDSLPVARLRLWLSARVQAALPGERGAFAAAIMTGDRSGMGQETLQALRDSNLAHLLAISGLHMGLLAGFVFAALRLILILPRHARHHWPGKKLAALGALLAAAGYLALSGGNVATERAFIMVAAALCALMLDRRALSLRSVAIAALVVLVMRPEALLGPGFQMSFAATTALVAVFEQVSLLQRDRKWPRWIAPILSVVVSSAVAGAATAPVGMAHFNQVAHFGLVANLVAVPVMGIWVVPLAVLAALLLPLGVDWIALELMALGLGWILGVAYTVADWEGSVGHVVAPGPWVLPLIAFGGLLMCLWRGRGRLAGLVPLSLAVAIWVGTDRPGVLISDSGTLVGIMLPEGRALSRDRGSGFVAGVWLENDGLGHVQPEAAALWPTPVEGRVARAIIGDLEILHLQGKRAARGVSGCHSGQIVVSSVALSLPGDCEVFDPPRLKESGSVAVWQKDGVQLVTDRDLSGRRLWHGGAPEPVRLARSAVAGQ